MNLLNDENVLNIFCDASIITEDDNILMRPVTTGCAGAILTRFANDKLNFWQESYRVLYDTTNNNSEITAILLGITEAIKYKNCFKVINLFSDSKICVFGLREWIFGWINNIRNGQMYSTTGPVANQDIIKNIINEIYFNNLAINIFHQKGHVTSTIKSIEHARIVFQASNNILLTRDEVITISYFNNMVDVRTKSILADQDVLANNKVKLIHPVEFDIEPSMMDLYKKLININMGDD